jgi:hypothetical protein
MRPEEEDIYQHPVTVVLVLFINYHLVSILPLGLTTSQRTSVMERKWVFVFLP